MHVRSQDQVALDFRMERIYAQIIIGRVSLACENEAGGIWGQEIHILHVNM